MASNGKRLALALFALAPALSTGCASQQKLKDYETEITALREERTRLRTENETYKNQISNYEAMLASGAQPASAIESYPELDTVGVGTELRNGELVITVSSDVSFASGKADLTSKGKDALKAVAKTLQEQYPAATYMINGHTDSDPIKKSKFESNRDLSLERAMSVLTFLVNECEIEDGQCVVAGYGPHQPIASNDTSSNKSKNRRVEIIVHVSSRS
jgi:chemotaxis protein MotB